MMGADAVIRVAVDGTVREVPGWSLGIEADDHGPTVASFVTDRPLPKFADIGIRVGGLRVFSGWVEDTETEDGMVVVTAAGEQRALDDDPYTRTYMAAGFRDAIDARAGPTVNQGYWVRSGLNLDTRSMVLGLQPNTIWYQGQSAGITYDLGFGGVGPRRVWVFEQARSMPAKTSLYLYVRAHSTRSNHAPPVAGQYLDATPVQLQGTGTLTWRPFTFNANTFRYVTVFLYSFATYDIAKTAPEYYALFSEVRVSTLPLPVVGSFNALNGYALNTSQVVPDIVGRVPRLTLGTVVPSTVDLPGLSTGGYALPREMLERVNIELWRYRVQPDRRVGFGPYPTLPTLTIGKQARGRWKEPATHSRVIVEYRDQTDEPGQVIRSRNSPRTRSEIITLGSPATATQAAVVADAYMAEQTQHRVEGTVTVTPGTLAARPGGEQLHPSRLLLAGGDRAHLDEPGDDGRIVTVSYSHDTETAEVSISDPQDDIDRELALLDVAADAD